MAQHLKLILTFANAYRLQRPDVGLGAGCKEHNEKRYLALFLDS